MVPPEGVLVQVVRQVLRADAVVRAPDAVLEQREERFDVLRSRVVLDVDVSLVPHTLVSLVLPADPAV